ncbi:MAG: hypothetical protein K1000chlam3_00834 [Chlamydiae bacterium]|nr:hypothetical protein [Chlamydiota bacterium]
MDNDIKIAGLNTAQQLETLHSKEFGGSEENNNSITVTILKILTIIAGVFFAMLSATSLPPDMAFVSITLIAVTVAALVTGAEKIVAVFPRSIWIWRSHYPSTTVHHYHEPVPNWSWYNPGTWRRSLSRTGGGGHSVHETTSPHRSNQPSRPTKSSFWRSWESSPSSSNPQCNNFPDPYNRKFCSNSECKGGHTGRGSRHHNSPYAGGTPNNVAKGSQKHDQRTTTRTGEVLVGNRRRGG